MPARTNRKNSSMKDRTPGNLFVQTAASGAKRHIYTVSELTQDIKVLLENTFTEVWVEGEVSGIRKISTGTIFLTLKDGASILKCVVFSQFARDIKFELKDGIKIICFGRIGVYEKDGQYQLYAETIEPKGIGSLQLAFEQLKERLEKEGLFSPGHKRPIPYLPAGIGVVTSLSGAAIKDILKVLDRRFSTARIVIGPAQVQGEGAKEEIARVIKEMNDFNDTLPAGQRIEVMIVGRGGGSIEDLWAFNEEIVARAIYNSRIPVISAVGHERDQTIADLVADLRAATPSAAAELVIPPKADLQEKVDALRQDLKRAFQNIAAAFQENIDNCALRMQLGIDTVLKISAATITATAKKLALLNPAMLIRQHIAKISDLSRQIYVRAAHFLELKQAGINSAAQKLDSLNPLNILSRGYSVAFKLPANDLIKDAALLQAGDSIRTRFAKGEITSRVTEVTKDGGTKI